MKADSAWQTLETKVAGTDTEYKDCTVTPLIATTPAATLPPGADVACLLPAEVGFGWGMLLAVLAAITALALQLVAEHLMSCPRRPPPPSLPAPLQPGDPAGPQLVVGCLDLNQGVTLPAEQLVGRLPLDGDRRRLRAYISNVATWAGARRQGVARRLLQEARREAAEAGVQHLYGASSVEGSWPGLAGPQTGGMRTACLLFRRRPCPSTPSAVHVEACNEPAATLYLSSGFEVESEESEAYARGANRNRRLLLHCRL